MVGWAVGTTKECGGNRKTSTWEQLLQQGAAREKQKVNKVHSATMWTSLPFSFFSLARKMEKMKGEEVHSATMWTSLVSFSFLGYTEEEVRHGFL